MKLGCPSWQLSETLSVSLQLTTCRSAGDSSNHSVTKGPTHKKEEQKQKVRVTWLPQKIHKEWCPEQIFSVDFLCLKQTCVEDSALIFALIRYCLTILCRYTTVSYCLYDLNLAICNSGHEGRKLNENSVSSPTSFQTVASMNRSQNIWSECAKLAYYWQASQSYQLC